MKQDEHEEVWPCRPYVASACSDSRFFEEWPRAAHMFSLLVMRSVYVESDSSTEVVVQASNGCGEYCASGAGITGDCLYAVTRDV